MARPANPYRLGAAQDPEGPFHGREDAIQLIESELRAPERSAVVVCGSRRIGKTALLVHLERRLTSPPFLPCYFDLRDRAHAPLSRVLFDLAATLSHQVHMEPLDATAFDDEGVHFRERFLPAFLKALPVEYRPVLLLDDLDVLGAVAAKQLPEAACARALPPYLFRLMEEEPRLGFVITSTRHMADLAPEVRVILRGAREKTLGLLAESSARSLAALAQAQGTLAFAEGALERVLALGSGHPYVLLLLCHHLFEDAWADADAVIPIVDEAAVARAAAKALSTGEALFEELLSELSPAERVVLSAIAAATPEGGAVTPEALHGLLQRHGIRVLLRELELAPEALLGRDLLTRCGRGLRLTVELSRQYLAERWPGRRVRAELREVVPAAHALYLSAERQRAQGALAEAQEALIKALRQNPNHLDARLLLSQVLFDQGRLEEARRELEEAARYDEEAARYPLIRVLLSHGEELERRGELQQARETYEQVRTTAPHEAVARERLEALERRERTAAPEGSRPEPEAVVAGGAPAPVPVFIEIERPAPERTFPVLPLFGAAALVLLAVTGAVLLRDRPVPPPAEAPPAPAQAAQRGPPGPAGPPLPRLRVDPTWASDQSRAAARRGQELFARDPRQALEHLREAHRLDPHPGWLYDLGIVHDQLGDCDDAAFFYRAAIFGKGVPAEEQALVDGRLQALEERCHFKRRQATVADRHSRAARYLDLRLCALSQSILSGIATPAEQAALERCFGRPLPRPAARRPPPRPAPSLAAARPEGQPALLSVTARPFAVVYVDGVRLSETPIREHPLRPGKHTVVLVNEALGKRQSYPIDATSGTTYTINYSWEAGPKR
jgi:tetratricopeptide (TPR) repeat protein